MSEKIFQAQVNYGWGLSLNMTGKAPAVAKRIFDTYADALAYVNDFKDSAVEGLQLAVVADEDTLKNGLYFVEKIGSEITSVDESGKVVGTNVAKNDGILTKVGGTETKTVNKYTDGVELSKKLVVGQIIKVTNDENVNVSVDGATTTLTYKSGFYIVNGSGSISALETSTGATDEIGALDTRVSALETNRVLVTDFNTYKTGVDETLNTKASVDDLNDVNEALDNRLKNLEAIEFEQIAVDAAGAAVAAIVAGADSDFDTLKEVADWILNDTTGAAGLQIKVSEHTESINTINDELDALDENKQSVIDDLQTIREGAAAGATALQEIPSEYITETELESYGYLTASDFSYVDNNDIDDLFK